MTAEQLTSLSRSADPRYPSVRLAMLGAAAAAAGVWAATLLGADPKVGPLAAALGVFLAWAIARELDPDHPTSAALAIPLSLVLSLVAGPAALLVSTTVLLGLRMTAGTVGTPLRPLDILGIIGLSAAVGGSLIGAVGVGAMVVGVVIDSVDRRRGIAIAFVSTAVFVVVALFVGVQRIWLAPTAADWTTVGLAVAGVLVVIPAPPPTSETDRRTGIVTRGRITAARVLAAVAILAAFVLAGGSGVAALAATVAAAVMGTAARRFVTAANEVRS